MPVSPAGSGPPAPPGTAVPGGLAGSAPARVDARLARRIVVAGVSGAGKTTLARRIAAVTGVPHTEIDGLHWHAGWTPNPRFAEEVAALAAGSSWVTELQYRRVIPVLAARADLLVWIDPPRRVVLARVVRRTVSRSLRRTALWHGNLEAPLRSFLTDPDHIVRWSMRTYASTPDRVRAALAAGPQLRCVRLRSERDVRRLLRLLAR